jgi:hypothetical protein
MVSRYHFNGIGIINGHDYGIGAVTFTLTVIVTLTVAVKMTMTVVVRVTLNHMVTLTITVTITVTLTAWSRRVSFCHDTSRFHENNLIFTVK